jgi:nucleotide-binding universal stress UspA family protein
MRFIRQISKVRVDKNFIKQSKAGFYGDGLIKVIPGDDKNQIPLTALKVHLFKKTMETIIVATDFSKPANNAVEYAAHLARFLNAKLVLVHSFSLPLGGYDMAAPLETFSDMRNKAIEKLKVIRDLLIGHSYDFGVECHAGLGSTLEVLKEAKDAYSAEMIVMGMVGEAGRIKEHLIGSNTLRVARDLSLPLFIIPEGVQYNPIHNICLAAVMKGIESNTLVYSARDIAKLFDATLEIVTVEKPAEEVVWEKPENYSFVERRLADTRHKLVHLREHNTELALEYYFKYHETDLVIVHPKKHSLFQKLFSGSITKHLAFHIRKPILVLH